MIELLIKNVNFSTQSPQAWDDAKWVCLEKRNIEELGKVRNGYPDTDKKPNKIDLFSHHQDQICELCDSESVRVRKRWNLRDLDALIIYLFLFSNFICFLIICIFFFLSWIYAHPFQGCNFHISKCQILWWIWVQCMTVECNLHHLSCTSVINSL